jgi:hypothetical protein
MTLIRRTAGIWGPAAFCGAAVVAARRLADYSQRSHHVSGLAALGERSARVMVPGFVALGASGLLMPTPDATLTRLARVAGTGATRFLAIIFTWHVLTAIMTLTRPG